ncbi:MAG: hypothetical protein GAK43_01560 [Stenotrophomonas maltophilia]|nr:MAG: hypothetical protein GAK43_01560 [Stenotrophomonas maltophilia]
MSPYDSASTDSLAFRQTLRAWLAGQGSNYSVQEARTLLANADGQSDWPALSRSYNGYVRELAVRLLARRPGTQALAILLERANDWVPSIREQALLGLAAYLEDVRVPQLLDNLPLLLALSRQQRGDHRPLLQGVQAVLARPQHHETVRVAWFALRGQASRFLFRLLAAADDSFELRAQALRHPDPVVRTLALESARTLPAEARTNLLRLALGNRSATVRGRALRAWLREAEAPAAALAQSLLDRSASVRSIALWHAAKLGVEPAQVLAQRSTAGLPLRTAEWLGVLGLAAALGQALPAHWLTSALAAPSARVRLAALAQLDDDALPSFIAALDAPSPKVYHGALERLRKLPWQVLQAPVSNYLDQRWAVLEPSRREAIFSLLAYWQRLAYLLRRMDNADTPGDWLKTLRRWSDQRYPALDPLTSESERNTVSERIRQLVDAGQLPKGSLTCLG